MRGMAILLVEVAVYALAARFTLRRLRGQAREVVFAGLNLAAFYLIFFHGNDGRPAWVFPAYLALIALQHLMLRWFGERQDRRVWLAFFTPLLALILIRFVPGALPSSKSGLLSLGVYFAGISYMAFRSSHLVLEVRQGVIPCPGFFEYVGFCFFLPTISIGPINSYSNHRRGFEMPPPLVQPAQAWLRILVGVIKYKFLGTLCFQLTYTNLLFDDHFHPPVDLAAAMLFYCLYLYLNFSGFCDIVIGGSALIGIPVAENFNNPFAARNVKDYWNRWHITLSQYMRDVVFTPLSKFLVRRTGMKYVHHAVALTIVVVFLLVGIWHGTGWNYAAFGAVHALGVAGNHYYSLGLKRWLGRNGYRAYNLNPWIHAIAVGLTFCYCAACLFLFANTFPEIRQILSIIK